MALVESIVRDIQDELDTKVFSVGRIVELINDGQRLVAAGRFPQYSEVGEIFLPSLEATDTIMTSSGSSSVALSGLSTYTFQKRLMYAYSITRAVPLKVLSSIDEMQRYYEDLADTGSIYYVYTRGGSLWYAKRATEQLRITFFRQPDDVTITSTETAIPDPFDKQILKNYVLMHVPKRFRGELGYDPEKEFRMYLGNLFGFLGPLGTSPVRINDTYMSYYDEQSFYS